MRKTLLTLLPVALIALSAPQSASAMPIDDLARKVVTAAEPVTYYGYGYYPRYRYHNYAPYYYSYRYKPYYYNYYSAPRYYYYPRRHYYYYRW
ncbi:MAG: hypothetical protein HY659_14660 [Rhizobiales bacterium]|nr:hypothetical protein [Hyphomicrobiales bacterium]